MGFRVWEVRLDYIKNYEIRKSGKNDFYRNPTVQELKLLANTLKNFFFLVIVLKTETAVKRPKAAKQ